MVIPFMSCRSACPPFPSSPSLPDESPLASSAYLDTEQAERSDWTESWNLSQRKKSRNEIGE